MSNPHRNDHAIDPTCSERVLMSGRRCIVIVMVAVMMRGISHRGNWTAGTSCWQERRDDCSERLQRQHRDQQHEHEIV